MTQIRCRSCRHFFDILEPACDECGTERHAYNTHLHGAKLNNHLYGMAENGAKQEKVSAYQAAREYTREVFA